MKKIISTILIIILITCIGSNVLAETAQDIQNKIDEAQEQQQQIKEERSDTMKEIEKLSENITESENQLAELTQELNKLETEIKETEEQLNEAQEDFDEQEALLKTRLIAQYKAGKTSYLDVLLNSTSITDFISRYHYVSIVAQKDSELLDEIQKEKERIEKAKEQLENQKNEYKIKKANAEKQNVILKNNKELKESYIDKLNDDEKELQRQIDEYTSELNKIKQAMLNETPNGNYNKYTGGVMAWPTRIEKRVNSIYAPNGRSDTFGYAGSAHRGVDIRAPQGTPIYAAADGQVIYVNRSGWGGGYGLYVVISHGNGIYTLYGHGSSVPGNINVGTVVTTDMVILYSGSTGAAEGAHLHFEVWEGQNNRVNPCPYLGIENKEGPVV